MEVQALHGMGGVGKTQLAIEYAYRYASDYDIVWWFAVEETESIGDQFVALAAAAGVAESNADLGLALRQLGAYLRGRPRWLVVFDHAEDPASLRRWLLGGPGHVMITSRNPAWGEVATPVAVDVFTRAESIALLQAELPNLTEDDADTLAADLGDLPLAVAHAAGMIAATGIPVAEYRRMLASQAGELMDDDPRPSYPVSLAAAVRIAVDRLTTEDRAAGQLLRICAWLGPEPIPVTTFIGAPDGLLPPPLSTVATRPLALRRSIGRIGHHGLARIDADGLQLHRLTQAILRDTQDAEHPDEIRSRVERLLVAAQPGTPQDPMHWIGWAQLVPHILALDPPRAITPEFRILASHMVWYLLERGDTRHGFTLADRSHRSWLSRYGPDNYETLEIAGALARASRDLGAPFKRSC